MKNVASIIDALGGNTTVASELHLTPSAVSEMKRRGRIPGRYWLSITNMAAKKNVGWITLDVLATITADGEAA